MRLIGAGAVMLSCIGIGCLSVIQMQKRIQALYDMRDAFLFLSGELAGKRLPLPELLQSCGRHTAGEAQLFFRKLTEKLSQLGEKPFSELWELMLEQELPQFTVSEKRELLSLGRLLGRASLSEQISAIESTCRFLTAVLEREEHLYRKDSRMRLTLPCAAGLLILILLF